MQGRDESTSAPFAPISRVDVLACTIPTDFPESDGTLRWDHTTVVFVEIHAGGEIGLGYTFNDPCTAILIHDRLAPLLDGADPLTIGACQALLLQRTRNLGRPGIVASALSAIDVALWDLKAKLLGVPLARLLGPLRDDVSIYGSGGFTSYDKERLLSYLGAQIEGGVSAVKIKVPAPPDTELDRLETARHVIGRDCVLMVDANGAYTLKEALRTAERFAAYDVRWFEEPVSSDDLEGLRRMRDHAPPRMEIAAGEYGYDQYYFRSMLEAGSVDVLQLDATRCLGYTGFLRAATLAESFHVPISAHTAPYLHLPCCLAAPGLLHAEYFHDHVRIADMLLDGASAPHRGRLRPDWSRPGHGLELKRRDARKYECQPER